MAVYCVIPPGFEIEAGDSASEMADLGVAISPPDWKLHIDSQYGLAYSSEIMPNSRIDGRSCTVLAYFAVPLAKSGVSFSSELFDDLRQQMIAIIRDRGTRLSRSSKGTITPILFNPTEAMLCDLEGILGRISLGEGH